MLVLFGFHAWFYLASFWVSVGFILVLFWSYLMFNLGFDVGFMRVLVWVLFWFLLWFYVGLIWGSMLLLCLGFTFGFMWVLLWFCVGSMWLPCWVLCGLYFGVRCVF